MRSIRKFSPDRHAAVHDALDGWTFTWRTCWSDSWRRTAVVARRARLLGRSDPGWLEAVVHDTPNDRSLNLHIGWTDNYRRLPAMLILAGLLLSIGAAAYAQSTPSSSNVLRRGWLGAPASKGAPQSIGLGNRNASGIGDGVRDRDDRETNQAMQPLPHPITDQ
jgi:hypothetical protein